MSKIGMHSVANDLNPFFKFIDEGEEMTIRDNEHTHKNLRA